MICVPNANIIFCSFHKNLARLFWYYWLRLLVPEQAADFKCKKLDGRYAQAGNTEQDEHLSWLTAITWLDLNVHPAVWRSCKPSQKKIPASQKTECSFWINIWLCAYVTERVSVEWKPSLFLFHEYWLVFTVSWSSFWFIAEEIKSLHLCFQYNLKPLGPYMLTEIWPNTVQS